MRTRLARSVVVACAVAAALAAASPTRLGAQQKPDRSKPPALGPVNRLTLPQIQKRTLANGLAVWLVESHEVPLVQVNLVVQAGSSDDPVAVPGVCARLTVLPAEPPREAATALPLAAAAGIGGTEIALTSGPPPAAAPVVASARPRASVSCLKSSRRCRR